MEGPGKLQPMQIAIIVESIIIVILLGAILFISRHGCLKKIKKGKDVTTCWESESPDPRITNGIRLQHQYPKPTHARSLSTIPNQANPKSRSGTTIYHSYTIPAGAVASRDPGQDGIPNSQNHGAGHAPKPFSPEFNLVVTDQGTPCGTPYILPANEINDWSQAISGFMNGGPVWSPDTTTTTTTTTDRRNTATSHRDTMLGLGIHTPGTSQPPGPFHLPKSQTWPALKDSDHQTHHTHLQSPSRAISPLSDTSNTYNHADRDTTPEMD